MGHAAWTVVICICILIMKGCSVRNITDVSILEDGSVQVLLPQRKCDFEISVLAVSGEQSYNPRALRVRECTTAVVISGFRGQAILIRVPKEQVEVEVVYLPTTAPSSKDMCRGEINQTTDLFTPFVYEEDYIHPARMYIFPNYSWASRAQFCDDERIQPTSCSNVSCSVSSCNSVVIQEEQFLYTAYHEKTCSTDSNNDMVCEAIRTHFNGTEWYRETLARQCVVVADVDTEQCLSNCKSLYNVTESSTVFCNYTSGECKIPFNQQSSAAPGKPTRPSLHERSVQSLTLSFSVEFGSAVIDYYLLRIYDADDRINITDTYYSNTTNTTDLGFTLVNITSGDLTFLTWEEEIVEGEGEEEEVVGYDVRLKVRDLEQGQEYVFAVAAGSAVGVGNFSDLSDRFSLKSANTTTNGNRNKSVDVVAVVLVVVLIAVVVVVVVIAALAIKKYVQQWNIRMNNILLL